MLTLSAAAEPDSVPSPIVSGPMPARVAPGDPSHDYPFLTPSEDLAKLGFVEEEFFLEGTANRYDTPAGQTGTVLSSGHPYRTRIVVRRPRAQRDFNGTVLLEWQNVTAGYDIDAHWGPSWKHFVRKGYAWVGVSAQRVGVHGAAVAPGTLPGTATPAPAAEPPVNRGLKAWSPLRYGTLDLTDGGRVTDDSLCYDVFSQAAKAVRETGVGRPLGSLKPQRVIAIGASQSAGRLSTYHNAVHPLHGVVDAYYLLVGGAGLRTDLPVKVFQYLSETDLGRGPSRRQEDSDHFRSWEVAGTAHSSYYSDEYRAPLIQRDFGEDPFPADCDRPPYSRVRGYYVINTQYDLLVRWLKHDVAPPTAPKLAFTEGETPAIMRDERGFAIGGIRLPDMEVPVALNTGANSGATFCSLYGSHEPYGAEKLAALYPSHDEYVKRVAAAARENDRAGYISSVAAAEYVWGAIFADVPPKQAHAAE